MRRAQRVWSGLSCVLLLALAAQAHAGNGWLEKLSGPGPFVGFDSPTIPLACRGRGWGLADSGGEGEGLKWRVGCPGYQREGRGTVILSLTFSNYKGDNFLPYDEPKERTVRLQSWAFSLDLRLHPGLDVGVGFGPNRFSGDDFGTFTRWSIDPVRILWRPIGLFAPDADPTHLGGPFYLSLRDLVQVKLRAVVFPQGFDAEDFGATGSFSERAELLLGASVMVGVVIWF